MESADLRLIFPVGLSPYGTRRKEGNAAVAMDPGFRADLGTAGAVLWAARPYLNDDPLHRRLLAERGGIAAGDLHQLADRRRRGRSIRDLSIGERREADPGFVPAPPARRPEEVRIQAVGRALDALESAGPSRDVPVGACVDIDSDIHADAFDRAPIRELISGYYRWETRQNPRHDPQAQSIRIRY